MKPSPPLGISRSSGRQLIPALVLPLVIDKGRHCRIGRQAVVLRGDDTKPDRQQIPAIKNGLTRCFVGQDRVTQSRSDTFFK